MDTSYDLIFTGENPGDQFGFTIGCGDVDNDGYGDIVIDFSYLPRQQSCTWTCLSLLGNSKSAMDAKADVVFDPQAEGIDYFGVEYSMF